MRLTVMVVGGGRVGSALARRLVEAGHHVVLVERHPERVHQLQGDVPAARLVAGEGTDPLVLEAAGIRPADVVTAVTGQDAANLVIAALARFEFGVPRTIARVVDPTHAWLFGDDSGVDVAVDQAELLTQLIADELSLPEMATPKLLWMSSYGEAISPWSRKSWHLGRRERDGLSRSSISRSDVWWSRSSATIRCSCPTATFDYGPTTRSSPSCTPARPAIWLACSRATALNTATKTFSGRSPRGSGRDGRSAERPNRAADP